MRDWFASLLQIQTPLLFVVFLRVVIGYSFFVQGNDKIREGYFEKMGPVEGQADHPLAIRLKVWMTEERRTGERGSEATVAARPDRMLPWYRFFLENAVLPNVRPFSILVTIGEILLGATLVLGLLTRVSSFVGILLVLNYIFATWHCGFPYTPLNILFIAILLVLLISGAGRCLGLDSVLHERYPEIPLF